MRPQEWGRCTQECVRHNPGGILLNMDRRTFLAATGTAFAQSPSDNVTAALIGAGGRGRYLAGVFAKDKDVRVGAVCDVYEPNLEKGLSETGNQARACRNYKQLLDNKEIDVVIIATPEH